jgi:hypothetical protein
MDPNANLQEQEYLLTHRRDRDDILWLRELRAALAGWLKSGGFEPTWTDCPAAAKYYGR